MRLPPSQRAAELERRESRKSRFQGRDVERLRQKQETARVVKRAQEAFLAAGAEGNPDVIDWDEYTIIGTCTQLEKRYLRLTSAPDPATVRPLNILRQTLDLLIGKWKMEQNYTYICDQFKSLRQDLTVQRIKNDLTVAVYETHARIALEKSDLGEYNQCQAQLLQLYKLHHLPGSVDEFTGYRILYLVHTSNRTELINQISELSEASKQGPCVQHALNVRTSIATGDYHRLFMLYNTAPKMAGYLMDQFVERERVRAMKAICKAYRPSIPVAHLAQELGFVHPQDLADDNATMIVEGRKACAKWLKKLTSNNASVVVWVADGKPHGSGSVETKESLKGFVGLVEAVKMKGVDIKGQIH
ncbi:SAC3/GANP/Nin1/mts3/eIF-3 p25 family-domain-containing protein [Powellomyces hirtus]|nr:SAC3/GANP/Nin1/mts3/eIF-3 p25 family-domain-containing protein [Powellomyces hirtus]